MPKSLPPTANSRRRSSSKLNPALVSSAGIAIIFHAGLLLIVGSVVIFEGKVPPIFFEGGVDAGAVTDEVEAPPMLMEDEVMPEPDSSAMETEVVEDISSDSMDLTDLVVTSIPTTAPLFSMPKSVGNPSITTGKIGFSGGQSGKPAGPGLGGGGKVKMSSLFGARNLGRGTLTGYFYDFKQNPEKEITDIGRAYSGGGGFSDRGGAYRTALSAFLKRWDSKELEGYFRSKDPLSLTQLFIPPMSANGAPAAFDLAKEVEPSGWLIVYRGNITPPRSGTFRLVGMGDDVLIARIDGDIVFDGSWSPGYQPDSALRERIGPAPHGPGMFAGKWIKMRIGDVYPMELLLGEVPGGSFCGFLMVQEKGVEYEMDPKGYPILPLFQMLPTELPDYDKSRAFKVLEDGLVFGSN